jgi:hypothetical protein
MIVVVNSWCCLCSAAEEVRLVRVAGEVQRGQGCRLACAGAHGVAVILALVWCRWCSHRRFSGKNPWCSV